MHLTRLKPGKGRRKRTLKMNELENEKVNMIYAETKWEESSVK